MKRTVKSLEDLASVRDYLIRVGATARSFRSAVVQEEVGGYKKDAVNISFDSAGLVRCRSVAHSPTTLEQQRITDEWAQIDWPVLKPLHRMVNPPDMVNDARPENVFEFRDTSGRIIMIQVRIELKKKDGTNERRFVPWTHWSDDQWRAQEPDGLLPLFNGHRLMEFETVFVHEGAKAARHVQWMVDGETPEAREALAKHPWGKELSSALHIGWIGGALSPARTDWAILRNSGVKRVYIVSDNDSVGREAVPVISNKIRLPAFQIQFTEEFPPGFDLADPFPKHMFGILGGTTFYTGKGFREYLHPATWATDLIPPPNGKGKGELQLRDCFRGMWAYIEEADLFVCTEMPDIIRTEAILNKMLSPFSHTANTTALILRAYQGRSTRICYRPDQDGLMVTFRGSSAINLHTPTQIRPVPGDPKPWLDFMEYMFPNARERTEVMRWCATLIAKPSVRMGYGLLLISERQGIGKTTLGSMILQPLVGENNVGYPSETDILSPFNDWVANKRLVIVSEIYSGSSWKAYHSLKATITDRDVTVNQKYMRPYIIDNWCHIVACSNSMRALKMENDDRRWFYPEITERPWPKSKFTELRSWLESGGLSIILQWAKDYGDYVDPSDRAPMTNRKKEMIEGSRSEAQKEAVALAENIVGSGDPIAVLIKDVVEWCRQQSQSKVFDTDYEIRKAMTDVGMVPFEKRIKVGGRLQYAILSPKLNEMVINDGDPISVIRSHVKRCADILETGI